MSDLQTGLRGSTETWRSTPPSPQVTDALLPPRKGSWVARLRACDSATYSVSDGQQSSSQTRASLTWDFPLLTGAMWVPSPPSYSAGAEG
jgi:hypothetical protein